MAQQLAIDEEEEAETARERAEYMMMFMNYEGVQKVRQARESRDDIKKIDDNTFNQQLEAMFGRGLPSEKKDSIRSTEMPEQELDEIKIVR